MSIKTKLELANVEMNKAVKERDAAFDGQFFYGVITTGVFCYPSCSTKAAKPENLRFFANIDAAMSAGFRPCKRCHSSDKGACDEKLIDIVRYIEAHSHEKITLSTLGERVGLSGPGLQKVFKQAFSISPKAYQDALRLRHFKQSLKKGEAITDAIYDAGFGSISRVYGEASRNMGMTPKAYKAGGAGEKINYACRQTLLGLMIMAATDKGVCSVQFGDTEDDLVAALSKEYPHADLRLSSAQDTPELDKWMQALDQHISLGAPRPDLPLDIRGTAFQMKVWQFLLSIKEGDVMTYKQVAEHIESPNAVRAVGTACGKNLLGVLIPCHRVLRSDGGLGGYRWGLERKQVLLKKEKSQQEKSCREGIQAVI